MRSILFAKFLPSVVPEWMTHVAGPLKGGVDEGVALLPGSLKKILDDRGDAASLARKAATIAGFLDTGTVDAH